METVKKILQKKVSFQKSARATLGAELTIEKVFLDIKKGIYKSQINTLRHFLKTGKKETYDMHKKKLPGVTFCGTFKGKRRREYLESYNELIVIDIDKLAPEQLMKVKKMLGNDNHVFAFWDSPSKGGVKGLVKIKYNFNYQERGIEITHKYAFKKLVDYFSNNYDIELDESGSDTTRLCFLSSDENLVLKDSYDNFEINEIADDTSTIRKNAEKTPIIHTIQKGGQKNNPEGRNLPQDRATMQSIIKYLSNRNLSITGDYESWYRVGFALANTFTHNIGEKYFLTLCRLDGSLHDEIASRNMLDYCYRNTRGDIGFSTIYFLASKLGFKQKRGEQYRREEGLTF